MKIEPRSITVKLVLLLIQGLESQPASSKIAQYLKRSEWYRTEHLRDNPLVISAYIQPTEKMQLMAVTQNWQAALSLESMTPQVRKILREAGQGRYVTDFERDGHATAKGLFELRQSNNDIRKVTSLTEKVIIEAIRNDPESIQYVNDPSIAAQLLAVGLRPDVIRFIKNPDETVQLAAIALSYADEPQLQGLRSLKLLQYITGRSAAISEQILLKTGEIKERGYCSPEEIRDVLKTLAGRDFNIRAAVLTVNPEAIKYMPDSPQELKKAALEADGTVIRFIASADDELKLEAVLQNGLAIEHIKNPQENIKLAAVGQNGMALRLISDPSYDLKLAAVSQDGLVIKYITNPDEKIKLAAVRQNGMALEYIKDASDDVKTAAVAENPEAIKFLIDNPSEQTFEMVQRPEVSLLVDISGQPLIYNAKVQVPANRKNTIDLHESLRLKAVDTNPEVIRFISSPSSEVQILVGKKQPLALENVKHKVPEAANLYDAAVMEREATAARYRNAARREQAEERQRRSHVARQRAAQERKEVERIERANALNRGSEGYGHH